MTTVGERAARGGAGIGETLHAMADMWGQGFRDNNPLLNGVLWNNNIREMTTQNPVAESVSQTLARMKDTRGAWTDERYSGFTGAQGSPLPQSEQTKVPTDPVMRQMYEAVSQEEKWIESKYMPEINRIKQTMGVMQTRPISESMKRDMHNEGTERMNAQYELIYQRITDLNAELSKMAGRHVDVRSKIDWSGNVSQFHASPGDGGAPAFK
jgi:hypothetical protein